MILDIEAQDNELQCFGDLDLIQCRAGDCRKTKQDRSTSSSGAGTTEHSAKVRTSSIPHSTNT